MPTKRELMFTEAAEQKAGQVGLGRAVTHLCEQAGLSRAALEKQSSLPGPTLDSIEGGDVDPTWGDLRRIAYSLNVELDNLLQLGIELAPGPAGDRLRQQEQEARDFRRAGRSQRRGEDEGSERDGRRGR